MLGFETITLAPIDARLIAPKLLTRLLDGGFTQSFLAKGRLESYVSRIPVRVVLNSDAALIGAAMFSQDAASYRQAA